MTGPVCLGLFLVVLATGLFLMLGYVPDAADGWSSVHHIESTPGGSVLRGLHFWATHLLIVAFAVHLVRLLLAASFRAPRELAWVSGVLIVPLLAAAAVTGNPLSASQKAIEQIAVESNIVGSTPVVGPAARTMLLGGSEAGSLTLTHLYALHVAFLPLVAAGVMGFHLYQLLRWGTVRHEDLPPRRRERVDPYYPDQMLRNAAAFSAVFLLAWYLAATVGAPLDVPADPEIESVPRPEWYFLFLFELRTMVPPDLEFLATGLFPAAVLGLLAALPWIDRLGVRVGAAVRYATVLGGGLLWCTLTLSAMDRDRADTHLREVRRGKLRAGGACRVPRLGPRRAAGGPVAAAPHRPQDPRADPVRPQLRELPPARRAGRGGDRNRRPGRPRRTCTGSGVRGGRPACWTRTAWPPPPTSGPPRSPKATWSTTCRTPCGTSTGTTPRPLPNCGGKVAAVAARARRRGGPAARPAGRVAPPDPALAARGRGLMAGELGCTDCHNFGDADRRLRLRSERLRLPGVAGGVHREPRAPPVLRRRETRCRCTPPARPATTRTCSPARRSGWSRTGCGATGRSREFPWRRRPAP